VTYNHHNTIAEFLDGTAARQPAPGGGSVAALVGALSAAIGEMVLNYSIGKKGLEPHQDSLNLHKNRKSTRKRKTAPPQTQHEEITEITRIEIESTAQRARGGEGLLSHRFAVPGLKDP